MLKKANSNFLCIALITFLTVFAAAPGFAQQDSETEGSPWDAEAELGYLMTDGNTETQSMNFRFDITREVTRWKHNLHYESLFRSETDEDTGEEETTAQRFLVSAQSNYKFDARNSAFLMGRYEDDRFSGYDYQYTVTAGYSRIFVKTESMELSGEVGPGYRYSKIDDDTVADNEEKEAILHVGGFFEYSFNSAAVFTQKVIVETGEDKTITRSVTALKSQIAGSLAMKASYTLKHTSRVPPDTEKTDTETALTLVYSF
ncbi:MAG: DUF481 domain-containing protein [Desulfobacteraceae bacterium]|nr:DUF481 domain-containing protein [Desulfobacteraceae bacterium]